MRTFKIQISFGTDSDKSPLTPNGKKEMAYNIGISVIVIIAAAVCLWRLV